MQFNHYARSAIPTSLHGILTPEEYEREISTLNDKIKKARATKIDMALLATGALMVPLAIWAPRHAKQTKRRRKLIEEGCWEFNERMSMDDNRNNVRMIWNRAKVVGGGESYLTIEEVESESREDVSKKFDWWTIKKQRVNNHIISMSEGLAICNTCMMWSMVVKMMQNQHSLPRQNYEL